jgi:hypothetical protein
LSGDWGSEDYDLTFCVNLPLGDPYVCHPPLTSSDGLWRAEMDAWGQVVELYPPDQPQVSNLDNSNAYVAGPPSMRSYPVYLMHLTEGPIVDQGGTHSYARCVPSAAGDCCIAHPTPGCEDPDCEALVCAVVPECCSMEWVPDCALVARELGCGCSIFHDISIEIENFMISGLDGGVLIRIRVTNESATDPVSTKIFYWGDLGIGGSGPDDEAAPVFEPPGQILALEQYEAPPADPAHPLWFGGCPGYVGWAIDQFADLALALNEGLSELPNWDNTSPGPLDHECALSGPTTLLQPGETLEMHLGIGGPGFDTCTAPCPCDCDDAQDGRVNVVDFLALIGDWGGTGPCDCADGGDGVVNVVDFLAMLGAWGSCP